MRAHARTHAHTHIYYLQGPTQKGEQEGVRGTGKVKMAPNRSLENSPRPLPSASLCGSVRQERPGRQGKGEAWEVARERALRCLGWKQFVSLGPGWGWGGEPEGRAGRQVQVSGGLGQAHPLTLAHSPTWAI